MEIYISETVSQLPQHVFAVPAPGITPFQGFGRFREAAHAHNRAQHAPRTLHSFRPGQDEPVEEIIRRLTDEWVHFISGESGVLPLLSFDAIAVQTGPTSRVSDT
jgi:hypothetical protein